MGTKENPTEIVVKGDRQVLRSRFPSTTTIGFDAVVTGTGEMRNRQNYELERQIGNTYRRRTQMYFLVQPGNTKIQTVLAHSGVPELSKYDAYHVNTHWYGYGKVQYTYGDRGAVMPVRKIMTITPIRLVDESREIEVDTSNRVAPTQPVPVENIIPVPRSVQQRELQKQHVMSAKNDSKNQWWKIVVVAIILLVLTTERTR